MELKLEDTYLNDVQLFSFSVEKMTDKDANLLMVICNAYVAALGLEFNGQLYRINKDNYEKEKKNSLLDKEEFFEGETNFPKKSVVKDTGGEW